jgi:hypothetical protein
MSLAFKSRIAENTPSEEPGNARDLAQFIPPEVFPLENPQTDLPRIAKDEKLVLLIEEAVRRIPTSHTLNLGDARGMSVSSLLDSEGIQELSRPDGSHRELRRIPRWAG